MEVRLESFESVAAAAVDLYLSVHTQTSSKLCIEI